jgi:kynureninase
MARLEIPPPGQVPFSIEETFALTLDAADPLARFRREFVLPSGPDGHPHAYFLGNSLGAMPRAARAEVEQVLEAWQRHGVEGFSAGAAPWATYQESFRDTLASLIGARPSEVVTMNTLTVNLHLLLASFYQPAGARVKVLMEDRAFPSDTYAVSSHLRLRGVDPAAGLVVARPRAGESWIRPDDLVALIAEQGNELALVLLGGVNYYTGQLFDLAAVVEAGHRVGAAVGLDLAHAIGNVPLSLHDWGTDFAVWCSYKYLNGGPGAIGGAFINERHGGAPALGRLAGWWGNAPASRFLMRPEFEADQGASGWQISTPPVLSMAPLRASLALFAEAGFAALRQKSESLTGYLEALVLGVPGSPVRILTPADTAARGAQLSLHLPGRGRWLHQSLREQGIVTDYRDPDVVRLAPAPLYNTYHEVWRAGLAIRRAVCP